MKRHEIKIICQPRPHINALQLFTFVVVGMKVEILTECLKQGLSLTKNGKHYFMEVPPGCPSGMYELMGDCWNFDRALRPSWSRIQETIENFCLGKSPMELND